MRWNRLCGAWALVLAVLAGCKQHCFMTESDFNRTVTTSLDGMDLKPDLGALPITAPVDAPPTLNNLERKVRFISLAECIATALEQGTVGQPSLLFPGTAQDNLVQFTGNGVAGSDAIRVFSLDPARAGADIEAALSRFDAVFHSSISWNNTDQPIGSVQQTFQAQRADITAIQQQDANFATALVKPLVGGGTVGVGFNVPYQFTNLPSRVNPSYRPSLVFGFDQPLLQGFGVEINQLRTSHPIFGSRVPNLVSNEGVGFGQFQPNQTPGILIARVRFDQQRAEFERQVNQMLLNVEVAYWNLYGAYWTLYSREQGLRFAFEAFNIARQGLAAGRVAAADYYQARAQYEQFRAQRLASLDQVLENERQLRALLGMAIEDGTRLMPADAPTLAPYQPDWHSALNDALTRRPELYMTRQEVKAAQLNVITQRNNLLPDLRLRATYDVNGLGTRMDGGSGGVLLPVSNLRPNGGIADVNAFRSLSEGNFNNWSVGLALNAPLGFRFAHSQVRQAELQLARTMETLRDQELKTQRFLALYYRRISTEYAQIGANRAQREAFGEQLRAREQIYRAGKGNLDILLEAQRFWANALAEEFQAVVRYNNALAGFEFAKGTILQHNNVTIAEGMLPHCAQVRAVENERRRTAALVLRERAAAITPVSHGSKSVSSKAAALPAALAAQPPFKDVPELPASPEDRAGEKLPRPVEIDPAELLPPPDKVAPARGVSQFGTARPETK